MKRFLAFIVFSLFILAFKADAQDGWTSLFDGKTLNGWKVLAGGASFSVENGAIVGTTVINSGNTFLVTEKQFGDFILELDVRIDDTTSNSGVQVRSHYNPEGHEGRGLVFGCQFELDPSSRKWSGGIYDEGRREWLYPGDLHAQTRYAFKLHEFNHIRIECIGHDMKTWINGQAIAYLVDTMDQKGFIGLQVHAINSPELAGKKIYFKNIRVQTSALHALPFPAGVYVVNQIPNMLTRYEQNNAWKLLFNGKNSDGWVGAYKKSFPDNGWSVKDGLMTVLSSEGKESANGGDVVTTDEYHAFDLSFEFRMTPGANSGVKYFVTLTENNTGSAIGLEYQILDDSLHPDAKLGKDGDRTLSSLYDLIPAHRQARFTRKIGQWNSGRIIVYPNNHVEHYLNGVKVLEYDRGSAAYRDLVAISKYKIWKNFGEAEKGHILLQDHGNEVSFRSIKIKSLN